MPLYEYYCPDCEITFEALRSMSKADAPIACPQCTGLEARRQLSLFAAFSKGNGSGETRSVAGSGGCAGCSGGSCSGGSCSGCGHH
ncbi:MAG: zinc ribbon domain-containing protein [Chloroflexi bacterium]|nr:zinc ribbon domain-containing protein [Chloroflexota bacterium]